MPEDNQQLKERKTLDERVRMTELARIRHSCAHVMATGIWHLWPDAQVAYGPPVMEMDEHRAGCQKLEARIGELEKQLADYVKKPSGE
jgi:threonyl-tRNA synthetase